jgi:23S rRNA (uracil747-C5)-methyltransferase
VHCSHFTARRCLSCTELATAYPDQLSAKQRHCAGLLSAWPRIDWLPPVASAESGFRNKAKMVVSGNARRPVLGILGADGKGVDLRDCGLYSASLQASFEAMADFIRDAGLTPYDVAQRRGELKFLLVTESPDGELMLRLVMRSEAQLPALRAGLPALLQRLPKLAVVSVNLQPEHKAVLEGEREILLSEHGDLRMPVNDRVLHLRPQSFFQTHTDIAAALYRQARDWVEEIRPTSIWDLYCGVGGFALHCAGPWRKVTGIELSAEAIASAIRSRDELGLARMEFIVGDATDYVRQASERPDLVIVNPPRRGIGEPLARLLDESPAVESVIYSSCNAESLARDLRSMPAFEPVRARLLDMFPHTGHYEVIVLLRRREVSST